MTDNSVEKNTEKKVYQQNIPKLRFEEFDDEWQRHTGENVFNLLGGASFKSSDSVKNGAIWLKIANVGINTIKTNELSFLPVEYLSTFEKYVLKKGDVIIALTRPILNHKLKIAIVDSTFDNSLLNQRVGKINVNEGNSLKFIYYYLQLPYSIYYLESKISGSDPPNLSNKDLLNIPVNLPSITEQKKISTVISCIDKKIELLTKKYQDYQEFKKYLLQNIFAQKLRFANYVDKWETYKLKELCAIVKGKQLNKENMIENGTYYVLNGGITPSGFTDDWNSPENTISISEGGNSCGYVNFNTKKFWSGGHCYTLDLSSNNNLNVYFLYSYLKSKEPEIMRLRVGSGLPNIQKCDIESIHIKIPSTLEEQNKIANLLWSTDQKIKLVNEQLSHVEDFKKGLLQSLFI